MNEISHFLTEDHERCDLLFAQAENAVAAGDWGEVNRGFAEFMAATLCHFAREETLLFPEFEANTGMAGGPTQVMREEHDQMRNALEAMAEAILRHDASAFLGLSETLLMLMRQHNLKEERILYPMADQALPDAAVLVGRMAALAD
jgi:hemerythrin-like domain-containing protein